MPSKVIIRASLDASDAQVLKAMSEEVGCTVLELAETVLSQVVRSYAMTKLASEEEQAVIAEGLAFSQVGRSTLQGVLKSFAAHVEGKND